MKLFSITFQYKFRAVSHFICSFFQLNVYFETFSLYQLSKISLKTFISSSQQDFNSKFLIVKCKPLVCSFNIRNFCSFIHFEIPQCLKLSKNTSILTQLLQCLVWLTKHKNEPAATQVAHLTLIFLNHILCMKFYQCINFQNMIPKILEVFQEKPIFFIFQIKKNVTLFLNTITRNFYLV